MTPTITDPATAPTVAPVVGKRARLRNGEIVGPIAYQSVHPPYHVSARNKEGWELTWADSGAYDLTVDLHANDIIAILDDEAAPEAQAEAEVAEITQVRIGYELSVEADDNRLRIDVVGDGAIITLTPAEARALLQVLPGLIKIAEGK